MPALAKAFTECIMKRCRYLKLFAYIMCLCNGLVVAVLGYASLTRLNVLSVESQRWGLYEHQRHLAALAVATIVLGSACALAAVLGCVDALLARRPHLACIAIIVNRVDQSQAEVQAKLDRANNLEEYRMKTVDQFIGSWAPRKSQSWGGNLDYSGSMFSGPVAARQAETAAATTPRTKLRFGAVRSPPERIRPPIKIVITEAQSDASTRATAGAAFQRDTQGEGGTLSLPDFSHYANVE
ncbi:hypothetical protein HPB52_013290 [Rhipicephalus sanguineus]|uniref:Tetraspanin n=1 Tax=Rhipicephalus sanguineus TaxID=34632 RepID=A0A9D4Q636_RHISA|nr:hypothetical protein HPB52_013290 [Rhipicephalus sanguineus]